jgi:hypothetical protein
MVFPRVWRLTAKTVEPIIVRTLTGRRKTRRLDGGALVKAAHNGETHGGAIDAAGEDGGAWAIQMARAYSSW